MSDGAQGVVVSLRMLIAAWLLGLAVVAVAAVVSGRSHRAELRTAQVAAAAALAERDAARAARQELVHRLVLLGHSWQQQAVITPAAPAAVLHRCAVQVLSTVDALAEPAGSARE